MDAAICQVELDTSEGLAAEGALASGPLKSSGDHVLDLVPIRHSLGLVNEHIRLNSASRAEAADGLGVAPVPAKLICEELRVLLVLAALNSYAAVVDSLEKGLAERLCFGVDPVVLVAALHQPRLRALDRHRLVECDYRLLYAESNVTEHVLQLTDADLQMQLACACNDELTRVLVGVYLDERVRLAEHLQLVGQLLRVLRPLGLNCLANDGSHSEGHVLQRRCLRVGDDGARLDEVLVNT
mmetsp:Transcript_868/g.3190  ORF Transcript_868/g.3190 Transcript_868/m.3190 type:complete len:241 (+) Transcript_868:644-1366(+)